MRLPLLFEWLWLVHHVGGGRYGGSCEVPWPGQGTSCSGDPTSLDWTLRPGCTDSSYFLGRNVAPKTAMGLSNPLFQKRGFGPEKGMAPAPTTHSPEPVPPMYANHSGPLPRPTASAVTPTRLPPAVSTSRSPGHLIPGPGRSTRA